MRLCPYCAAPNCMFSPHVPMSHRGRPSNLNAALAGATCATAWFFVGFFGAWLFEVTR